MSIQQASCKKCGQSIYRDTSKANGKWQHEDPGATAISAVGEHKAAK